MNLPVVDLLICAHAFVRVPDSVLVRAGAAIGYHPSLLPLYKGMRSIEETLAAGDPVTGGTVLHLTDEMDGGPVVFPDWCFVRPGETAAELWRRALASIGVELLVKSTDHLAHGGVRAASAVNNLKAVLIKWPGRATKTYDIKSRIQTGY